MISTGSKHSGDSPNQSPCSSRHHRQRQCCQPGPSRIASILPFSWTFPPPSSSSSRPATLASFPVLQHILYVPTPPAPRQQLAFKPLLPWTLMANTCKAAVHPPALPVGVDSSHLPVDMVGIFFFMHCLSHHLRWHIKS